MGQQPDYDAAAFKRFEQEGWREVAGTYHDAFAQVTRQAIEPLLDAVGAGPGMDLLDVACGPGVMTAAAAARGAQATGLDFVAGMVAEAARRHPDCTFREGDAEALPFDGGSFDAVVCGFGILHFPHPERAVAEAFRVLRPGGRYGFTAWTPDTESAVGLVQAAVEAHGKLDVGVPAGPPPRRFGDPAACREVLEAAGFADVTTRRLEVAFRVSEPEEVMSILMRGTARNRGLLVRQTPEARARIEAAVAQAVRRYATDEGYVVPNPALLVVARKP